MIEVYESCIIRIKDDVKHVSLRSHSTSNQLTSLLWAYQPKWFSPPLKNPEAEVGPVLHRKVHYIRYSHNIPPSEIPFLYNYMSPIRPSPPIYPPLVLILDSANPPEE